MTSHSNVVFTDRAAVHDTGGATRVAVWWQDRHQIAGHAGFYVWQHEGGSHYAVADDFGVLTNVGPARSRSQVPEALNH